MSTFQELWKHHPTISGDDEPCSTNGKSNYDDQCAIRLGVSLALIGVDTKKIAGAEHCWHHEKSAGHILRAAQLAKGLSTTLIKGIGKQQIISSNEFATKLSGKTGIVFFQDYARRGKETFPNRSGDHIDLWNGTRLTHWATWFRIQYGITWDGVWSDYRNSKKILFFPVL